MCSRVYVCACACVPVHESNMSALRQVCVLWMPG